MAKLYETATCIVLTRPSADATPGSTAHGEWTDGTFRTSVIAISPESDSLATRFFDLVIDSGIQGLKALVPISIPSSSSSKLCSRSAINAGLSCSCEFQLHRTGVAS